MIKRYSFYLAWLISLVATLASLFYSEIQGIVPCKLCWYQKVFLFPLPLILFPAVFMRKSDIIPYFLPLPLGGLILSIFQLRDRYSICSTCVITEFIPFLSLIAFFLINIFLLTAYFRRRPKMAKPTYNLNVEEV